MCRCFLGRLSSSSRIWSITPSHGPSFGRFTGCDDPDGEPGDVSPGPARRFTAEQVLRDRTADLGIPVVAGLPVGHEPGNAALPLGVRARLDGERGLLQILS